MTSQPLAATSQPLAASATPAASMSAAGPLIVSPENPRYFTVAGGDDGPRRAVYLTGSHIWNNFHDGMGPGPACAATPEVNDFAAYLRFLQEHGHNFIRLWRWEHVRSQAAGGAFHLCMSPQPWARTGPGTAIDGRPTFDLATFDPAYFARLRDRVVAAGNAGIYVGVMLFEGWGLHLSPAPDNVAGHPCHAANNVNGISLTSIKDYQVLPLPPAVQALQEAYMRQVIDTVQDLPNVLYEVANESTGGGTFDPAIVAAGGLAPDQNAPGDSTDWQYWVIGFVKRYERERGYAAHPIGMTMQYPVPDQSKVNDPLFNGPADWISPGFDDQPMPGFPGGSLPRWYADPPPNDGTKVVIADTDHFAAGMGDALWVWKTFLRGHHPILMDYGIIDVVAPLDPALGVPPYEAFAAARQAMGDTCRAAERMNLLAMTPRGELCSTGYLLAHPGVEYLALQPEETGDPFTVTLAPGAYAAEWHDLTTRATTVGDPVTITGEAPARFTPPGGAGPVVLSLKRVEQA